MEDFSSYLKKGIEILKLNRDVAAQVSTEEKATTWALIFVAIGGLLSAVGTLNPAALIAGPIGAVIGFGIGIGIMHLLAKLFGGKAGFMEYFRAAGVGNVGSWIIVIPIIGPLLSGLVGLWYLVVHVNILKAVHKLTTGKAVIVVLIPLVVAVIFAFTLAAFIMAMLIPVITQTNTGTFPIQ